MSGPIEAFMTADHTELDALLERGAFDQLRRRLLKHIAMEEKVLLPFARERLGEPLAIAAHLRADHGRIAKLLVPTPTPELMARLREVLAAHNPLEEGPSGLYAQCDELALGDETAALLERLRAQPDVPVAPHYDGPLVHRK